MVQYSHIDSPMSPQSFLSIVHKRRKLIMGLFALIFFAVVIGTFLMPPTYRAQAKVMVNYLLDTDKAHLLDLYLVNDTSYYDRLNSELLIFKMRSILDPVVESLGLTTNTGRYEADHQQQRVIEKVRENLQVEREKDTNVLAISYDHMNPRLAASIVERVVSEYVDQRPELNKDERIYEFLDSQITILRDQINHIKQESMEYQQKQKIIAPDRQAEILFTSIADFDKELTKVRAERISREANLQVIRDQIAGDENVAIPTVKSSESFSRFEYINKLKTRLLDLELEKSRLEQRYTEKHHQVQRVIADIKETNSKREQEIDEIIQAEEATIKAIRAAETSLAARMKQAVDSISKLSMQQYELGTITIGIEDLQSVLSMLMKQREEARISANKSEYLIQVRLLEPAFVPSKPIQPNPPLYIGIGFLLALIVAFGTAFFVEYFDHSVNSAEDAQHCLGLPILATIPEFSANLPKSKADDKEYAKY